MQRMELGSSLSTDPELVEQCVKQLDRHGFDVFCCATASEARECARRLVAKIRPKSASYGHSATLAEVGILDDLATTPGLHFLDGFDPSLSSEERLEIRRQALTVDLFFAGINAISADGTLYWMDKVGNRVAPIAFGPKRVILVASTLKIVPDPTAAQDLIKNIAPQNAMAHPNYSTPCQKTAHCHNCNSPDRFCNISLALHRSFPPHRISVILVDDQLGLCPLAAEAADSTGVRG